MWPFTTLPRRNRSTRFSSRPQLEALEDRCLLSGPGSLDTTFGSGGSVTTYFTKTNAYGTSVAVQSDGKIVAAGYATNTSFAIARYNTNGTLDSTFGSGGTVKTALSQSGDNSSLSANMILQPDGKILMGGQDNTGAYELARYNTNGTLDTSFGLSHNGTLLTNFGVWLEGLSVEMVAGSPKLVTSVRAGLGVQSEIGLARYNLDGSLDSTFGSGGEVVTPNTTFYTFYVRPGCLTAQADGKILVGGYGAYTNGGTGQFVVARYDTSGNLDPSFGSGGYAVIAGGEADSLVVQPDGKIVAGSILAGVGKLVRLNVGVVGQPDGSLDLTFGSGGVAPTATGNSPGSLVIQTNGKMVSGESSIARYNPDGSVDAGFGTAGVATMPSSVAESAVALQTDGKIVAVGKTPYSHKDGFGFEVARFLGDPIPVIGSFKANPNPVTAGSTTTLTVSGITDANPRTSITQVALYVDSNSDGKLEPGSDTLVGYAAQTNPGVWTFTYTVNLPAGTYTLFAQAGDNFSLFSNPFALTLTVQ